jgi:hypothetical protein
MNNKIPYKKNGLIWVIASNGSNNWPIVKENGGSIVIFDKMD